MQMLISREWLRKKIESDPDVEVEAGRPIEVLDDIGMFLSADVVGQPEPKSELKEAFGVLVRQLRRRDGLSVQDLSTKARVQEDELRRIERDPHYLPRPRTVHQIANVFNVPERAFMKLSGATITHDQAFRDEALKFAAKSDDIAKLSRDEQRVLNSYIKYLSESS